MAHDHHYALRVVWTGNRGSGTTGYRDYGRDHDILVDGRPVLKGSADPAFRGDRDRHNPEDMLVASLSACHMLWYLHLCAEAGVAVQSYEDDASGSMQMASDGGGAFREVVLRPVVTIRPTDDAARAEDLHEKAAALCFIARSVNFPVRHEPVVRVAS